MMSDAHHDMVPASAAASKTSSSVPPVDDNQASVITTDTNASASANAPTVTTSTTCAATRRASLVPITVPAMSSMVAPTALVTIMTPQTTTIDTAMVIEGTSTANAETATPTTMQPPAPQRPSCRTSFGESQRCLSIVSGTSNDNNSVVSTTATDSSSDIAPTNTTTKIDTAAAAATLQQQRYERRIAALQTQLEQTQQNVATVQMRLHTVERDNTGLKRRLHEAETTTGEAVVKTMALGRITAELSRTHAQLDAARQECDVARETERDMATQLQRQEQAAARSAEQVTSLQHDKKQLQDSVTQLEQERAELTRAVAEIEQQRRQAADETKAVVSRKTESEQDQCKQLALARRELNDARAQQESMQLELEAMTAQYEQHVARSRAHIDALQTELHEEQATKSEQQMKLTEHEQRAFAGRMAEQSAAQEVRLLDEANATLTEQLERHVAALAETDVIVRARDGELAEARKQAAHEQQQLREANDDLACLKTRHTETQAQCTAARAELSRVRASLDEMTARNAQLSEQLVELRTERADSRRVTQRIKHELATTMTALAEATAAHADCDAERQKTRRTHATTVKNMATEHENSVSVLTQQLAAASATVTETTAEMERLAAAVAAHVVDTDRLRESLSQLEGDAAIAATEHKATAASLAVSEATLVSTQTACAAASAQVETLTETVTQLQEAQQHHVATAVELKSKITSLTQARAQQTERAAQFERQRDMAQTHLTELHQRYDDTIKAVGELETRQRNSARQRDEERSSEKRLRDQLTAERDAALTQLAEVETAAASHTQTIDTVNSALEQCEREKQALDETVATLITDMEEHDRAATLQLNKAASAHQSVAAALHRRVEDATATVTSLTQEIELWQSKYDSLLEQHTSLQSHADAQATTLNQTASELNQLQEQHKELQRDAAGVAEELKRVKAAAAAAAATSAATAERMCRDNENVTFELTCARDDAIAQMAALTASSAATTAKLEAATAQLTERDQQHQSLLQQLLLQQEQLVEYRKDVAGLQRDRVSAETKKQRLHKIINEISAQRDSCTRAISDLENEKTQLQASVDDKTTQLARITSSHSSDSATMEKYRVELDNGRTKLNKLSTRLTITTKELKSSKHEVARLRLHLEEKDQQVSDIQRNLAAMTTMLRQMKRGNLHGTSAKELQFCSAAVDSMTTSVTKAAMAAVTTAGGRAQPSSASASLQETPRSAVLCTPTTSGYSLFTATPTPASIVNTNAQHSQQQQQQRRMPPPQSTPTCLTPHYKLKTQDLFAVQTSTSSRSHARSTVRQPLRPPSTQTPEVGLLSRTPAANDTDACVHFSVAADTAIGDDATVNDPNAVKSEETTIVDGDTVDSEHGLLDISVRKRLPTPHHSIKSVTSRDDDTAGKPITTTTPSLATTADTSTAGSPKLSNMVPSVDVSHCQKQVATKVGSLSVTSRRLQQRKSIGIFKSSAVNQLGRSTNCDGVANTSVSENKNPNTHDDPTNHGCDATKKSNDTTVDGHGAVGVDTNDSSTGGGGKHLLINKLKQSGRRRMTLGVLSERHRQ